MVIIWYNCGAVLELADKLVLEASVHDVRVQVPSALPSESEETGF
jgi:hypothetical protein